MLNLFKKKESNRDDISTIFNNKKLLLPYDHPLLNHQMTYKLYDRFLPVLTSCLPNNHEIIDIGANIGDTLISSINDKTLQYFCIEPSDFFHTFLQKNIQNLDTELKDKIRVFKNLIGTGDFNGTLDKYHEGSAKIKLDENIKSEFVLLDDLISSQSEITLLKIDTDGYDFDVLESSLQICKRCEPILFWENEIKEEFQMLGFKKIYEKLTSIGYDIIYIFDNFGNLILEDADFKTLEQLNNYIFTMEKNSCTRTIFYTDILACTIKNKKYVMDAINKYKRNFILK